MSRYTIKAVVAVDVEISIEAASEADARSRFDEQIAFNATLVDTPDSEFDVSEDSILSISNVRISHG